MADAQLCRRVGASASSFQLLSASPLPPSPSPPFIPNPSPNWNAWYRSDPWSPSGPPSSSRQWSLETEPEDELKQLSQGTNVLQIQEEAYDNTFKSAQSPKPINNRHMEEGQDKTAGSSTALLTVLNHLPRYPDLASAGVEKGPGMTKNYAADSCPSPLTVKKLIKGWDGTLRCDADNPCWRLYGTFFSFSSSLPLPLSLRSSRLPGEFWSGRGGGGGGSSPSLFPFCIVRGRDPRRVACICKPSLRACSLFILLSFFDSFLFLSLILFSLPSVLYFPISSSFLLILSHEASPSLLWAFCPSV